MSALIAVIQNLFASVFFSEHVQCVVRVRTASVIAGPKEEVQGMGWGGGGAGGERALAQQGQSVLLKTCSWVSLLVSEVLALLSYCCASFISDLCRHKTLDSGSREPSECDCARRRPSAGKHSVWLL